MMDADDTATALRVAAAATIKRPGGMTDTPCPPDEPKSELIIAAVQNILTPGPMDLEMLKAWLAPEAVSDRQAKIAAQRAQDWPKLCQYRAANALLQGKERPLIVFMGDSFTELWGVADPTLFSDRIVNRGISGQTAPQMLVRFYADVVALKPRYVHIKAGGNDIAGNTGPSSPIDFQNNITAMADLATANGIQVVLGTLGPAKRLLWAPEVDPLPWIERLNAWIRAFAAERGYRLIDYHAAIPKQDGGTRSDLTKDGAHLTIAGYALLRPLLEALFAEIDA